MKRFKNIYFLGIGGIGMSALARWFHSSGSYHVAGYDLHPSPLTRALERDGMMVSYEDSPKAVPPRFTSSPSDTLIIYTPAVPVENKLRIFFYANNFCLKKRAQVLGELSRDFLSVTVAGTHGKTTISTLLAHLLYTSQLHCSALLGGIATNYETNMLRSPDSDILVLEADEYDKSFLHLHPDLAIVTAMDADHLDIYGTHEELIKAFGQFVGLLPSNGLVLINEKISARVNPRCFRLTYGLTPEADIHPKQISREGGSTTFDMVHGQNVLRQLRMPLIGNYNIENALAAVAMAIQLGVPEGIIKQALRSFKGVKRRAECVLEGSRILIDDYAHHPQEIAVFLEAVKMAYPHKRLTVIFQPHLYSRTRDFASSFAKSLSFADDVILLDIYPAREAPIPGVTSETIAQYLPKCVVAPDRGALLALIQKLAPEVLLTVGAGDIDKYIMDLKQCLIAFDA